MASLPSTDDSLLVRTDYGDQLAWVRTREAALAENEDGFRAYVAVIDEPSLANAGWENLRAAARETGQHATVLFIADQEAMGKEHPIQVVDLSDEKRQPFRCAAAVLWSVDNNLNLANMDWEEFASTVGADGVHRGFG